MALVLVGGIAALVLVGDSWGGWGFPWPLFVIGLIAFLILSTRGTKALMETGPDASAPSAVPSAGPPTAPPTYAAAVQRRYSKPRKPGPILFWYTMALVALVLSTLGIADAAGAEITDSAYPALALAVIGVMLVIGAFFGRAGGLIMAGLVVAVVTAASTAAGEWDFGEIDQRPRTAASLDSRYSLTAGQITLDLTDVADVAALDGRTLHLDVSFGQIEVLLPEGLDVKVEAELEGDGRSELFGSSRTELLVRDLHRLARGPVPDHRGRGRLRRDRDRHHREDQLMSDTVATGRHPVNVGHLVMGVAFLGLTFVWALIASDAVEGSDIRWLMPIPWVAAGVAGVLASVLASRRSRRQARTGWVTDDSTTTDTEPTETDPTETTPEENR